MDKTHNLVAIFAIISLVFFHITQINCHLPAKLKNNVSLLKHKLGPL